MYYFQTLNNQGIDESIFFVLLPLHYEVSVWYQIIYLSLHMLLS